MIWLTDALKRYVSKFNKLNVAYWYKTGFESYFLKFKRNINCYRYLIFSMIYFCFDNKFYDSLLFLTFQGLLFYIIYEVCYLCNKWLLNNLLNQVSKCTVYLCLTKLVVFMHDLLIIVYTILIGKVHKLFMEKFKL